MSQTLKLASALALAFGLAAGCSSQSNHTLSSASGNAVLLSAIGEESYDLNSAAASYAAPTRGAYMLGAGDALGQALFANYVAIARANRQDDENQRVVSGESASNVAPTQR